MMEKDRSSRISSTKEMFPRMWGRNALTFQKCKNYVQLPRMKKKVRI